MPKLVIEPIATNSVLVELESGVVIQISDTTPLGAEIQIAENRRNLSLAKMKRISVTLPGVNEMEELTVEVKAGWNKR